MTKPIIAIHNSETGEFIEREMNDAELAALGLTADEIAALSN